MIADVVLASSSERRKSLLETAGFRVVAVVPEVDDGSIRIRANFAERECMALAWFKAAQIIRDRVGLLRRAPDARVLVSADTVCVVDDVVMGKPPTADVARRMLASAFGRSQGVVTGVCLVDLVQGERTLFSAVSRVRLGVPTEAQFEQHLAGEGWRGRAGGYNIGSLVAAGWPVSWDGDQTTIVGLPMHLVAPRLSAMLSQGKMQR